MSLSLMKFFRSSFFRIMIGFLVAAFALYLSFRGTSFYAMIHSFENVAWKWIIFTAIAGLFANVFRSFRWAQFVQSKKPEVGGIRMLSVTFIGYSALILPARIGEFVKLILLMKKEKLSFGFSASTILIERVYDVLTVLCILGYLMVFHIDLYRSFDQIVIPGIGKLSLTTQIYRFGLTGFTLAVILIIGFIILYKSPDFIYHMIHRVCLGFKGIEARLMRLMESFREGLLVFGHPRQFFLSLIFNFLIWSSFVLTFWGTLMAYPSLRVHATLISVLLIHMNVVILIALMPTPGFLGPFQWGCVFTLVNMLGADRGAAVAFSLSCWLLQFIPMMIVSFGFIIFQKGFSLKEVMEDSTGKSEILSSNET